MDVHAKALEDLKGSPLTDMLDEYKKVVADEARKEVRSLDIPTQIKETAERRVREASDNILNVIMPQHVNALVTSLVNASHQSLIDRLDASEKKCQRLQEALIALHQKMHKMHQKMHQLAPEEVDDGTEGTDRQAAPGERADCEHV